MVLQGSSSVKRFFRSPRSRRCVWITAVQIAFLLAFCAVHLLWWSASSPRSSAPDLCPGVALLNPEGVSLEHLRGRNISLPSPTDLSKRLQKGNGFPPRNTDLFPRLPHDHLVFVLYVHNRPAYLRAAVAGLSRVDGIGEALLIVSHDGFFDEMNAIIDSIRFCQVKQIFAPFSPHIYPDSFPGQSPGDCQGKDDPAEKLCQGGADQYGNHRAPHIVSLKHHWWWMMNTVWDGLQETRTYNGHIVFIEEDHYLFPNAYRNMQMLTSMKACKCPQCYAANLAPADVNFRGERTEMLIAEKIGNVGYAFNRTVWRKIHSYDVQFCSFDDYNWDITMWVAVYPDWSDQAFTLRGPRPSAAHFGKCGLHQGNKKGASPCLDEGGQLPIVEEEDTVPNIKVDWQVTHTPIKGYNKGFKGWGGWGDARDHKLCLAFASMYHVDHLAGWKSVF